MIVWPILGAILALTGFVLWVHWLLKPSSATWPQGHLRATFLHGIPAALGGCAIVLLMNIAEQLGVPETLITNVAALPVLLVIAFGLLVILVTAGVPAPPFLVPGWIRAQDREWRAARKTVRAQRKRERQAARAAQRAGADRRG
ncbi:hypothetical protein [Leucobacter sp. M11]|uniref:hypothetical protein n=1 Tax=Leucobacter sp. M11 TaxID=2993565 RepID=UPI002D7E744A|nr:hypothetical protein [Leucobacter sp. M11]MEB4616445.1 hypothetical protein [Leucobacter sp. M11]